MCSKSWLLIGLSLPLMAQPDDSATLRAILQEIRELRQELREGTVLAARFRDLENRLQMQREKVDRAEAKYEKTVGLLRAAEGARDRAAEDLKYATAAISSVTAEEEGLNVEDRIFPRDAREQSANIGTGANRCRRCDAAGIRRS